MLFLIVLRFRRVTPDCTLRFACEGDMSWLPKRDKLDPVQASGVAWCGAGGEEEGGESRWRWRCCGRDGEVGGLNGRTTDRV